MVHHVVRLNARGLTLEVEGDRLMVSPRSRIEPPPAEWSDHYPASELELMRQERAELVAYIRDHKAEIMAALQAGDMWEERRKSYGEIYRAPVAIDPPVNPLEKA